MKTLGQPQRLGVFGAVENEADLVFGAYLISSVKRDQCHDTNRHGHRQPTLRDREGVDAGTHDMGGPGVLADIVGEH
jgi:hypothetical protein